MDLVDNAYQWNPFAPLYFTGLNLPPSEETGYVLHHYEYVYNNIPNVLSPNQFFQDSIAVHPGMDFWMTAFYASIFPGNTAAIQLVDQTGYELFSGYLPFNGISTSRIEPTPLSPKHRFAQATKIILNFQAFSGAQSAFQLVFLGFTAQKADSR